LRQTSDPLRHFYPSVQEWFRGSFDAPTRAQALGWEAIARGASTLLLAPTGSGKTLAAFLAAIDRLLFSPAPAAVEGDAARAILAHLDEHGASFFPGIARATGIFQGDLLHALWDLVWAGAITNDTLAPLRSLLAAAAGGARRKPGRGRPSLRSSRLGPPGSEGRWSRLVPTEAAKAPSATERRAALASALLDRHGVLTREAVLAEGSAGGYASVYGVLKAMEEAGKVRRGYFIAGLGATQFAARGADDRLRALKAPAEEPRAWVLSAVDPANPYGAALRWPEAAGARLERRAGAMVVLCDGALVAYLGRSERNLLTFLPADEPARGSVARALARALAALVEQGERSAFLVSKIDGVEPHRSALAPHLREAGFLPGGAGFLKSGREAADDRWVRRARSRGINL
jgi:ATP-dependent Lhr-like helicase